MKLSQKLIIAGILFSSVVQANDSYDWARVLRAEPVRELYRTPVDREVCWNEQVRHRDRRGNDTATVVGGIIGGVIGNQFGRGHGRDAATVAGAALGASIAHDNARRNDRHYVTTERRCRVETDYREEERTVGYDVTYRYKGETYHARLPEHPGDRLRVRVEVTPAY
ncbi:MAG: glycine zipper 2TM domain-containing protein [bacterium]